jgi:hypothetical protein
VDVVNLFLFKENNMIYGIYLKSKPKNKWQLMSVATSQEVAVNDLKETLKQAHAEGNEQVMSR